MAKSTTTGITAAQAYQIDLATFKDYKITAVVAGTWDSASGTFQVSPDGGTTKINLEDSSGVVTVTANKLVNIDLNGMSTSSADTPRLYFTPSSVGASTNLTVYVFNNRG